MTATARPITGPRSARARDLGAPRGGRARSATGRRSAPHSSPAPAAPATALSRYTRKVSNHPLVACEDPAGWRRGANMNLRAMVAADANTAERQRNCGVVPVGSQVEIRRKHDSAYYCGVATCGNVWLCPVCSAKIRERSAWKKVTAGAAWQRLKRRLGIAGHVIALEFTWGEDHRWHPHNHILLVHDQDLDAGAIARVHAHIHSRLAAACRDFGLREPDPLHGVRIDPNVSGTAAGAYVAKGGDCTPRRRSDQRRPQDRQSGQPDAIPDPRRPLPDRRLARPPIVAPVQPRHARPSRRAMVTPPASTHARPNRGARTRRRRASQRRRQRRSDSSHPAPGLVAHSARWTRARRPCRCRARRPRGRELTHQANLPTRGPTAEICGGG